MTIHQIKKKISNCSICHLSSSEEKLAPLPGRGLNGTYMIVGLAPSWNRKNLDLHDEVMPLDNPQFTSSWLGKLFNDINWPLKHTYITNLIKCSLPENRTPDIKDWKTCVSVHFLQEIFFFVPTKIICLGNDVFDIVQEISELSNSTWEIHKVFHHAYISRTPSKYEDWKDQWLNIK